MNRRYIIYLIIALILSLIVNFFFIIKNDDFSKKDKNEAVDNVIKNNIIEENIKYNILGTYNAQRPYGTEAFTYVFSENSVIYASDSYNEGTYEIENNTIKIIYSITHYPVDGSLMDFVRQTEELRIEDENTLISSSGTKFYKTSDKTALE